MFRQANPLLKGNSQPTGFYAPAQIVRDAQNRGVPVGSENARCRAARVGDGSSGMPDTFTALGATAKLLPTA